MALPVQCVPGKDCFIQNYVDSNPAKNAYADYKCGHHSYDGHKGTDIRLRTVKSLEAGVPVLAAAAGTVRGVRDGMADRSVRDLGVSSVLSRECGNGVVITHGEGYETQYCHMKQGSVKVKTGQPVETGDTLGMVGLSGLTEFPHLHIELRKDGKTIDPFTGQEAGKTACGKAEGTPFWNTDAVSALAYAPTALLNLGFAGEKADAVASSQGKYDNFTFTSKTQALIFFAETMGPEKGDVLSLKLTGPDGTVLAEHNETLDSDKATSFFFIGKRKPDMGWTSGPEYQGEYTGEVSLKRGAVVLFSEERRIKLTE